MVVVSWETVILTKLIGDDKIWYVQVRDAATFATAEHEGVETTVSSPVISPDQVNGMSMTSYPSVGIEFLGVRLKVS